MGQQQKSVLAHVLLSSTLLLGTLAFPASNNAPTVTIAPGIVVGTKTKPPGGGSSVAASAFLGIPYAMSPPQRFSPPQPAAPWSSPLSAQAFRPACMQQFATHGDAQNMQKAYFGNPAGPLTAESEDCLYLNIFAPPTASPRNKKAVLFWIYPGDLQFGTASLPIYDGTSLALSQDVVVVTFNFRTNIFGFPNSPELPNGSKNLGYLDQRLALQWVQENIGNFGGDASRVTIFGDSAGGESVKQLLANPPNPLPFSAAIMQSQQLLIIGDGPGSYKLVTQKFGCQDAPSPLECLRNVPATDIKSFIEMTDLAFKPVDGDGTSVTDVRDSIRSKQWPNIPVMIGSALNESTPFVAVYAKEYTSPIDYALSLLGIQSSIVQQTIQAQVKSSVGSDSLAIGNRILTDAIFTCPVSWLSSFLAQNGYTAYRYRYDAQFASTQIFDGAGVYHSSDVPSVFGTYPLFKYGAVTPQQTALSSKMQSIWAGFAKNPAGGVGWAKVGSASGVELALLGTGGTSGVTMVQSSTADSMCPLYLLPADLAGFAW